LIAVGRRTRFVSSVKARSDASVHPVRLLASIGFAAIVAYLVVVPLVRVQQLALQDGAAGYSSAADAIGLRDAIVRTVLLASGSVAIALVCGTGLAWAATRLPARLRWLGVVPLLPIISPAVATTIGWAFLLSPEAGYLNVLWRKLPFATGTSGPVNVYTVPWIVTIVGISLSAFVYMFVRSGLSNMNEELVEAAEVCGSSSRAAFFTVVLPLLRPVLVYGGSTALLLGLGQVTVPLILGRREGVDVLTTVLYRFTSDAPPDYGAAAALGSPLLLAGLLIVAVQRAMLGDNSRFVTHGGKSFRAAARSSRTAAVALAGYGVVAVALPLGALVIVAVSPFWSPNIRVDLFTLDNFRELLERREIVDAVRNSVLLSAGAVLVSLPVGFVAASIIFKAPTRWVARTVDVLVNLPMGIPAVVFGAGFLFTYTRPPAVLYGTPWVILLVYVTVMLPFTTRFQLSAMMAVGTAYEEASHTSGAGFVRTTAEIVVPMLRPALVGAGTTMLILLSHEFSASLLVRSVRTQVMGTQLYDYWTTGSYPLVAAFALAMCVVTGACVAVASRLGGRGALDHL